jgi:hypothetical protein
MKHFKIIVYAIFISFLFIAVSANGQEDNSKNEKEKKTYEDKSKAGQGIETGWDATKKGTKTGWEATKKGTKTGWEETKKGTKTGYNETKEFLVGEETEKDKAKKSQKKAKKSQKKAEKDKKKATKKED